MQEKQAKNVANLTAALSSESQVAWQARSMQEAGPLWELQVGEYGDLISVRDGKRTRLNMPSFRKSTEANWFGQPSFFAQGKNFTIEISGEPCGDWPNG